MIMKKITSFILMGVVLLGTSCKKYLDINSNPNSATSATPKLILPQALTATAGMMNSYNNYGAQMVGYMANAGGYGGFGSAVTYSFSANDFTGLWSGTYDNLEDYQTIINQSAGKPEYTYFKAVARIMKAMDYQLLVDTYNDVPYNEALKGADNLTPAYTDAKVIYKDLAAQLDTAITEINAGATVPGVTPLSSSDVMFKGDYTKWKQFANTLKLRLMIHASGKVTFNNTTFSSDGFLTSDAMINPGYIRDNGKQNPKWNNWGFTSTGGDATKSWMPTTFILGFYNGAKLSDNYRGPAIYYKFPSTPTNRLGYENSSVVSSPSGSFWYPNNDRTAATAGNVTGVLKGPEASMPVLTASESYFLQAEGRLKGLITTGDDVATLFKNGMVASFHYLYLKSDNKTLAADPATDVASYISDNSGSYLVNFSIATSADQQLEAIITQKYIALNMVNSDQAWDDYRRTHYPTIISTAGATGTQTFASLQSQSSRPDKLPTRVLYPTSEGSYNTSNMPKGISPFTSTIFWAL